MKSGAPARPSDSPAKLPSGSGFDLPAIANIVWEAKPDGSIEAWHTPRPGAPRRERTYLKRVGKRLLAEWAALPDDQRRAVVEQWVSEQRREKGNCNNNDL